jgi:hypothetical protein
MIYIASPYSSPDEETKERRYNEVCVFTGYLLAQWKWCYSPIVHCHELAKKCELPTDFDFWQYYNFAMISKCKELYVLELDGWLESKGVREEIRYAKNVLNLPCLSWRHNGFVWVGAPLP